MRLQLPRPPLPFGPGGARGLALVLLALMALSCAQAERPSAAPSLGAATTAPTTSAPRVPSPPARLTYHGVDGTPVVPPPGMAVPSIHLLDTAIQAFEPTLAILPDGSVAYQGWTRPTSGETGTSHVYVGHGSDLRFREISPSPVTPTHDPYLAVDPRTGRIFSASLLVPGELEPDEFCVVVQFTDDAGASWVNGDPVCDVDADRPRLIAAASVALEPGDSSLLHLCYAHARTDGQTCLRSADGGATFQPSGSIPPDGCDPGVAGPIFGHLASDPDGTLYLGRISCRRPVIAISRDQGATWVEHVVGPEGWNGFPEIAVAVDGDGVIYGLWVSNDRLPYLVASPDGGVSWTDPMMVAAPGVTEVNLVALEAGAGGRLAIGALVSTDAPAGVKPAAAVECGLGPCRDALFYDHVTWHASLTLTTSAATAAPVFVSAILNDPPTPIIRGACGPGRCKSNADFIDLAIDGEGTPWMAFVACPQGVCPTRPVGGYWGSSAGMLGWVTGLPLR